MFDWRQEIGKHNNAIAPYIPPQRNIKLWELIFSIYKGLLAVEEKQNEISQTSLRVSETFFYSKRSRSRNSSPNLMTAIFFLVLFYPELIQGLDLSFNIDFKQDDIFDNNEMVSPSSAINTRPIQRMNANPSSRREINSEAKKTPKKTQHKKVKNSEIDLLDNTNHTKLMNAVTNNDRKLVQQLLQVGADVEIVNNAGNTALMQAAIHNLTDIAGDLLAAGANPDIKNYNQITPLLVACEKGFLGVVKLLIHYDADVNIARGDGITPIYLAANNNEITIANLLVQHGAEIDKYIDPKEQCSPLHHAATENSSETIKNLIAIGSNLELIDRHQQTPLFVAVKNRCFQAAETLIKKGANLDVRNNEQLTLLAQAIKNGDAAMVSLLLENGANVEAFTGKENPLLQAIVAKHANIVAILLKHNANINIRYEHGNSALIHALGVGRPDILKMLIDQGASLNEKNESGFTPFHFAVCYGNLEIISLLITSGANQNVQDIRHHLPSDMAEYYIHFTKDKNLKDKAERGKKFYDQYLRISKLIEEGDYSDAIYEIKHSPIEYQRQEVFQELLKQANIVTKLEPESYSWKKIIGGLFVLLGITGYLFRNRLGKLLGFKEKLTLPKPIQLSAETIEKCKETLRTLLQNIANIEHEANNEFSLSLVKSIIKQQTPDIEINKSLSKELLMIIKEYLKAWGDLNLQTGIFKLDVSKVDEFVSQANNLAKHKQLKFELDYKIMECLREQVEQSAIQLSIDLENADTVSFSTQVEFEKKMASYKETIKSHLNDNKKWCDAELLLETERNNGFRYYNTIKNFREKRLNKLKQEIEEINKNLLTLKTKKMSDADFVTIHDNRNSIEGLKNEGQKYLLAINELSSEDYETRLNNKIKEASNSHGKQSKRKSKSKWSMPEFLLKNTEETDFQETKIESEPSSTSNTETQKLITPKQENKDSKPPHRDLYHKDTLTVSKPTEPEIKKITLAQVNKQQLFIAKDLCTALLALPKSQVDSISPQLYPAAISRIIILLNIQILECLIQASKKNDLELTELAEYLNIPNTKNFRGIFRKFWMELIQPETESGLGKIFLESSTHTAKLLRDQFLAFCLEDKKFIGNYNPEANELYKEYASRLNNLELKISFKSFLYYLQNEITFIKECLTRLQHQDINDQNKKHIYEKSLQASVLFIGYLRRVFRVNYPELFSKITSSEDKSKICTDTRRNIHRVFFQKPTKPSRKPKTKTETKNKENIFNAKVYDNFKKELRDVKQTPFYNLLVLLSLEEGKILLKDILSEEELWMVAEEFNNMLAHDIPKFKLNIIKIEVINLLAEIIAERLPNLLEKKIQNHYQYRCRTVSSLRLVMTILQQPPHPPTEDLMKLTDYINDYAFPTTQPRFYSLTDTPAKETNFAAFFKMKYQPKNKLIALKSSDSDNTPTLAREGEVEGPHQADFRQAASL